MENFNEYWELFVDKKDSIAKEIIAYYKTLDDREDGTELSEQCCAFFAKNILVNPYPTCQLLKLLAMSKIPGKNNTIYEIATSAALKAFADDQRAVDPSKCYSILANCLISVKAISSLKPQMIHALEFKQIDLEWLMLALFARKSLKLLINLLPELSAPLKQQWTCDALEKKQHFVSSFLDSKQIYVHHANYIRFMQQVVLANTAEGSFSSLSLDIRPMHDQIKGRSYLTAYLLELQRCYLLQDALHSVDKALLPSWDFSQHSTVIEILARTKMNLSGCDFSTIFELMGKNHSLIEQIAVSLGEKIPMECSETMQLIQIQTLMVLFKAIESSFGSEGNENISSSNLDAQLKSLLKETDLQTFVLAIESIVTMLFVRSECLISDGGPTATEGKYFLCSLPLLGIVATCIKATMITRKHSAAYLEASEHWKHRFQTVLDHVIDVCWRLSLFDADASLAQENAPPATGQLDKNPARHAVQLTDLLSVPMMQPIENYWEPSKSSSTDRGSLFRSVESINGTDGSSAAHRQRFGRYGTLPRQKPARRHTRYPLTATGSSNSGGSNKDLRRQTSESIPYAVDGDGEAHHSEAKSAASNRKAFTKLFASPETLAIVCLTNDKLDSAKQIIDNHNLHELPVGRLVQRIEQMQSLSSNLAALVQKHERREQESKQATEGRSDTLLDDIRSKTAFGFEISKVLSTVETFLKSQSAGVEEPETLPDDGMGVLAPMDRFVGRYPFLGVHTGKNLHLSQIVDTVLGLPFRYELNLAIYNFLLKNAKPSAGVPSLAMSTSMSGTGVGEMSPLVGNFVTFFGSLIDTLQIAQRTTRGPGGTGSADFSLTVGHFLSREICPLDAVENGVVLKRRARFYSMSERGEELKRAGSIDRQLGLLTGASGSPSLGRTKQFLGHLVDLVDTLEIPSTEGDGRQVNELIKMDLPGILLDGLFGRKMSLRTLDAMASKLGVHLVQIIGQKILRTTGEPADETNHTNVDGLWDFIASKSDLLLRLCQTQRDEFAPPEADISHSLIRQYKNLRNATPSEGSLPLIRCNRAEGQSGDKDESQHLFPLEAACACCPLKTGKCDDSPVRPTSLRSCSDGKDMERIAHELLANVDRFANASEWISASEHLLTAIRGTISAPVRAQLHAKANQLRTYLQIGNILQAQLPPAMEGDGGWRGVRSFSESNKSVILQQLIEGGEYRVCSEWIKLHPIEAERELEMFMYAVHRVTAASPTPEAVLMRGSETPAGLLFAIIETMPVEAVVKLYETMMLNIRSVPVVSYMLEYLQRHGARKPLYQKYAITLRIFEYLARDEYDGLWNLASRPLLIIEQCLMNSRLELLGAVMRSVRPLLVEELCRPCYEHREYIRDLHEQLPSGTAPVGATRLNPVHDGLFIGHECVDCLFRVYAGKALEYKVFAESPLPAGLEDDEAGHGCRLSRVSSYDSLSEIARPFVIPKEIPPRDRWVKDEDALHCMCCRRTFSMLNRRHHCRRCGRVVCHSCSKRKERLSSELYEDVAVRVCDDCWQHLDKERNEGCAGGSTVGGRQVGSGPHSLTGSPDGSGQFEWQLTGNERYDNVIRDEYSYEYAPSTGQCLAICSLHTANEEIGAFLLYHCAKLEALLRPLHPGFPNPEVDYALVARMLLNLTLGVKVRGGGAEVEKMKEHAEIILSIVHDNCESLLLHTAPLGNHHGSLRKLRDALVKAEKWTLALELSLKCGFSLNGVMAAWGMTCLRAGCYETAREKFSHCLPRVASDAECEAVLRMIETPPGMAKTVSSSSSSSSSDVAIVKRPARCPPLLNEVLYALSCTARLEAPSQRVMARVRAAKQQSTGSPATHEPALNILSTLANLRHICQGEFREVDGVMEEQHTSLMDSRLFEESMHYLLAYGSHQSVVAFLMRHQQTEVAALRYILCQRVEPDVFLQAVLLPYLQRGALETIVQRLTDLDETLLQWRDYIRYTCRYLETNDMLNSLYNLQLLLKDPIRASMTCVRFYIAGCRTFTELHASEHHLKTSITHLQNELELCNWQEVRLNSTGSVVETHRSLLMKLDPKELNNHINTILLQLEVTKFLAKCEAKGRPTVTVLPKIFRDTTQLPTLFGSSQEKLQLAILTLVCGQNVEEAFGLSYRIVQDYNLDVQRVYALTAKYFINHAKIEDVGKLLDAIVGNNGVGTATDSVVSAVCDEIVRVSVDLAIDRHGAGVDTKVALEALISRARSVGVRIHCYIVSGQLKTAYLLANRHHRISDIRKVLRQAELLGQTHVKRLCEVRLNHQEGGTTGSPAGEVTPGETER
ncbi:zinc finger FYVE domain-containing protein 26 homolog [Anopheles ziemanni]|uniref:zinc finger FYVE domain-containing protein 26 homolog n=1 Tax=Anopheles coustani TaxID=139045 RepID=UPI00265A54C0|nr:zinc finger FYVE domain-containing protein 26 homolog [Anopheles coustani]XP_058166248.1 zinc finger FYVE domain-containing protein 26 homolog [Anopheles ziemanni]